MKLPSGMPYVTEDTIEQVLSEIDKLGGWSAAEAIAVSEFATKQPDLRRAMYKMAPVEAEIAVDMAKMLIQFLPVEDVMPSAIAAAFMTGAYVMYSILERAATIEP